MGGLIELVAGLLIAIGLFTSWAAFIASGEMAAAGAAVARGHGHPPYSRATARSTKAISRPTYVPRT